MTDRREFDPLQAQEIARAFNGKGVEYLFIGKSGAILLGFPGTTQDVDIFPARSAANSRRIVAALRDIGFDIPPGLEADIIAGKDFVQIKTGPFDVNLVFARRYFPRRQSAGYYRQQACQRTTKRPT